MKILISGSHGFIGSALHTRLQQQDHSLLRLIRLTQVAHSDE
ncbi:MAG: NAD-dependent epimerase/dehydratase family protein, partial [Planctomycetota bacterium]